MALPRSLSFSSSLCNDGRCSWHDLRAPHLPPSESTGPNRTWTGRGGPDKVPRQLPWGSSCLRGSEVTPASGAYSWLSLWCCLQESRTLRRDCPKCTHVYTHACVHTHTPLPRGKRQHQDPRTLGFHVVLCASVFSSVKWTIDFSYALFTRNSED